MTIRLATVADRDFVMEKTLAFNDTYYDVPVDLDRLSEWYRQHLAQGVIFISNTGYLAGLYVDDPVRNWTALVETGWYDEGRNGLRTLRAFIHHGRELGMDEVRMTTLNTTPASVLTLLGRMGFEEIERSHRLTL